MHSALSNCQSLKYYRITLLGWKNGIKKLEIEVTLKLNMSFWNIIQNYLNFHSYLYTSFITAVIIFKV